MTHVAFAMSGLGWYFGMLGFVFAVSAYCKLEELEKRLARLESASKEAAQSLKDDGP